MAKEDRNQRHHISIKGQEDVGFSTTKTHGLPTRWETNDKFVAGDQWPPLPSNAHPQLKQMPKPVFNICKQIVNFKSAAVKSENVKMIFSPFGSGGSEGNAFNDDIKDIGELMNRLTEVTWERTKMDFVASRTEVQ